MLIQDVVKRSIPYKGRKYENMTVLQRLRCDLYNEAADYEHTMMHAYRPHFQRKAIKAIGDELVEIAQNYAWRYAKHRQMDLIDSILEVATDNRILEKDTVLLLLKNRRENIVKDLDTYQQQFKNMELM
jgi:hypothetical protein